MQLKLRPIMMSKLPHRGIHRGTVGVLCDIGGQSVEGGWRRTERDHREPAPPVRLCGSLERGEVGGGVIGAARLLGEVQPGLNPVNWSTASDCKPQSASGKHRRWAEHIAHRTACVGGVAPESGPKTGMAKFEPKPSI